MLAGLWRKWDHFFFEAQAPEQLRGFRFCFGWLLVAFYLIRGLDLEFYFSQSGMLPLDVMNATMPMQYRYSLFQLFPSDLGIWTGHWVLIASLAALAVGFYPRVSATIAFVLHVSFLHRNMASIFGIDMISTFFLLYFCFVRLDARRGSLARALTSVAFRLGQLQICIIYAYSGLEKVKGPAWWKGEAIWDVMANSQLARMDFSWLAHLPLVIVAATYLTLAWEVYFPVLVWLKPVRRPMLLFGAALHVGIAIALNIPFFGMLMIISYALFLTPQEARALRRAPAPLRRSRQARRETPPASAEAA
jgi:hypothetical protein